MGVEYYNPSSSNSNSSGGILYRPKPLALTSRLYGDGSGTNDSPIPVFRSGASDKSFLGTTTTLTLYTTSSIGVRSTVNSVGFVTYLGSSSGIAYHLSSADTCLYVVLQAGTSYQLIKMNDTTGTVTAIGSSFIPTIVGNWSGSTVGMTLSIDTVSGHLKYVCNGVYHLINKTTGAIVSQNTPLTIGSYLPTDVYYITQDGTLGLTSNLGNTGGVTGYSSFPKMVHSSYGHLGSMVLPSASTGLLVYQTTTAPIYFNQGVFVLVDSDKVLITYSFSSTTTACAAKYYLLSEMDKYLKSVAELGAGVI